MMNSQHPAARGTGSLGPFLLALVTVLGTSMSTQAEPPPLIPRDILFGNPEKTSPQISPDGKRLAWIAPDKKNVLQVWVKTIGKDDDKVVTADPKRGIRQYFLGPEQQDADLQPGQRRRRELPPLRSRPGLGQRPRPHAVPGRQGPVDGHRPELPRHDPGLAQRARSLAVRRLPARPEHRGTDARHGEPRRRRSAGRPTRISRSAPPRRAHPTAAS